MGKQLLLFDKVETVDEILAKIDAVTAEDVQRLAKELFVEENMRIAMIGPDDKEDHFASLLHY